MGAKELIFWSVRITMDVFWYGFAIGFLGTSILCLAWGLMATGGDGK